MMGATGMPTPSEFWQDTIVTDYIDPATNADYTPVTVATPASYASTSAPIGLADLQAAMAAQQLNYPGDPYLVEGYSQSAQIVVAEKIELMEAGQHPDVTFLTLGDPYRPNGGMVERLTGLVVPGIGLFNGENPTDAVPYDQIVNELDTDFNPFTAFFDLEAPLGQGLDSLFEATGIQQFILDPILGIIGPLGGLFTS